MSRENLTQNLNVRIDVPLQKELAEAADRDDCTVGEFVRRAVRTELTAASDRALNPFAALDSGEVEQHLLEAFRALGNPEAAAALIEPIADECTDAMDAVSQVFSVIDDETAHMRFERISGFLQQASLSILRAASRTKAIRAHRAIADGELERIEARLSVGEARP